MSIPVITIRAPTEAELPEVYELRYKTLREPWDQPRGSERSIEDETQTHLALFEDNQLVATARLDRLSPVLAQIRCVGVADGSKGKGYGTMLMKEMESVARKMGFSELTLHARINAVMFYHRLGYTFISPSYYLWDQIQHYEMRKSLPNDNKNLNDDDHGCYLANSRDQDIYANLTKSLESNGVEATKALVDIFIADIVKNSPNIKKSVETTPTNDGKFYTPPQ